MHVYMTEVIGHMGLQEARGRVGPHPPGLEPRIWREQIADDAARAVAGGWINLDLAHDMILVADLLVAEMVRYPQIIGWPNAIYDEAAYYGYDPEMAEAETRGELLSSPDDAFIDAFLDSLITEEPAHA